MARADFIEYGALLTEIITKLRSSPNRFTRTVNKPEKQITYTTNIDDDYKILLEKERREDYTLDESRPSHKEVYRLRILKNRSHLVFDDEGIDTNNREILGLRSLFHEVDSFFNVLERFHVTKPADKNKVLLEELLEKLGGK